VSPVLLFLAAYGLAWVLSASKITFGLRELLDDRGFDWTVALMECPGCVGFWTGLIYGACTMPLPDPRVLIYAFAVCASNMLLNTVVILGEHHA